MDHEGLSDNYPEYEKSAIELYQLAEHLFEQRNIPSKSPDFKYAELEITSDELDILTPVFIRNLTDNPLAGEITLIEQGDHASLQVSLKSEHTGSLYHTLYRVLIAISDKTITMVKDVSENPSTALKANPEALIITGATLDPSEKTMLRQLVLTLTHYSN